MSNSTVSVLTNVRCCDGLEIDVVAITLFSLLVVGISLLGIGICSLIVLFARLRVKAALQAQQEQDAASHNRKEERRCDATRSRMEFISNGLIIKEWVSPNESPNDQPVESAEGDQDNPTPSGETVEASPPPPPSSQINSSLVPCAMGGDDCDSFAREDEMADCAICLSHFKPQQLVCESNNSSCRHVFHKDCMVDWLMKHHDECPMCREIYLIKAV
jgi:hypothetical protein